MGSFAVNLWTNMVEMYELQQVVRQPEPSWVALLNRVRVGMQTDNDLCRINRLVSNTVPPSAHRACHYNRKVDEFNAQAMANCNEIIDVLAYDSIKNAEELPQEIRVSILAKARSMDSKKTASMSYLLRLAIGQRYMIISNINKRDGLLNGTVGILRHISRDAQNGTVEIAWLEITDTSVGRESRRKFSATHKFLVDQGLTPIKREMRDFPVPLGRGYRGAYRVEWRQFPFVHAQAITIHKFQGKTEDFLELDFECRAAVHGLTYVGLSRCRTEKGNRLIFPLAHKDINVSKPVNTEIDRLRKKGFDLTLRFPSSCNGFKVLFHNVQSI